MLMVHRLCMIDCRDVLHLHQRIFGFLFAITAALFLPLLFVLIEDFWTKICLPYHQCKFNIFKGPSFWKLRGVQEASLLVVYDKK